MKTTIFSAALAALFLIPACAAETSAPSEPVREESPTDLGKADGLKADNWTYYSARPDYRKCMWPMCGGYFVSRVNQPETKCADGKWAKECYVSQIDWNAVGLTAEEASEASGNAYGGKVVMKGDFAAAATGSIKYTVFAATEGWTAATDAAPTGIFYKAKDTGVKCITYPCPSIEATRLNRNKKPTATYAGLDLSPSGASDDQISAAWEDLTHDGLVISADTTVVKGPAGQAQGLIASQFYTPIKHKDAVACHTTGCSGEICAPEGTDVVSICLWKPEYACYQNYGKCAAQPNGKCGWSPSAELDACLNGGGGCPVIGLCVEGYTWNDTTCQCEPVAGEKCGNNVCAAGQVCCNASCGICTDPGMFCTQQACS